MMHVKILALCVVGLVFQYGCGDEIVEEKLNKSDNNFSSSEYKR